MGQLTSAELETLAAALSILDDASDAGPGAEGATLPSPEGRGAAAQATLGDACDAAPGAEGTALSAPEGRGAAAALGQLSRAELETLAEALSKLDVASNAEPGAEGSAPEGHGAARQPTRAEFETLTAALSKLDIAVPHYDAGTIMLFVPEGHDAAALGQLTRAELENLAVALVLLDVASLTAAAPVLARVLAPDWVPVVLEHYPIMWRAIQGLIWSNYWPEGWPKEDLCRNNLCDTAARLGILPLLKWRRANQYDRYEWTEHTFEMAAREGHVHVLEWIAAQDPPCPASPKAWLGAAYNGQIEVFAWLLARGLPWHPRVCAIAAQQGQLDALKWLRANGAPWDAEACERAAQCGQLGALEWLCANGAPLNVTAFAGAARGGQAAVLEWLLAAGAPWDATVCAAAARGGHLALLKWLRAAGAPWDESVCAGAAEAGDLEMLIWLRSSGAPWDYRVLRNARDAHSEKHTRIINWATAYGCPEPPPRGW